MAYFKGSDEDKDFVPKRYCTCINNGGRKYEILDDDEWKGGIGLHCVLCGHFRWQEYVVMQIGRRKARLN